METGIGITQFIKQDICRRQRRMAAKIHLCGGGKPAQRDALFMTDEEGRF